MPGRNAGKDQPGTAGVVNAVRNPGGSRKDGSLADRQFLLSFCQEMPLSFQHDPDMVAGVDVGMNMLARFEAPESSAGVGTFGQNDLAGFFVTVADLVAIIAGLDCHFALQVVKLEAVPFVGSARHVYSCNNLAQRVFESEKYTLRAEERMK